MSFNQIYIEGVFSDPDSGVHGYEGPRLPQKDLAVHIPGHMHERSFPWSAARDMLKDSKLDRVFVYSLPGGQSGAGAI